MSATDLDMETEAMEYVLGLMSPDERREFQADLLDDPELADAVWQAEGMLTPLAAVLPERKPSPAVLKGLEQRLFAGSKAAAAPAPVRKGASRTGRAVWSGLTTLFFVSTVAALFVIGVLLARPITIEVPGPVQYVEAEAPAPGPELIAGVPAGSEVLIARVLPDGRLAVSAMTPGEGTDYELWFMPQSGDPVSLGLVGASGETVLTVPPALAGEVDAGAAVALSEEPEGGSPTGRPTGDVLGTGTFKSI